MPDNHTPAPSIFSPLAKALLDGFSEGVVVFDPQGKVLYANAQARDGLADRERDAIVRTLDQHGWKLAETAKHLGISRTTLWRRLKAYGLHKGFSMTGWRLGHMAGPKWLADACNKVQGQITSGAASFSQEAAVTALKADRSEAMAMKEAFLRRRDLLISLMSKIPGLKLNKPQGAFYIFPDVSKYFGTSNGTVAINNADDFAEAMLTEAHVGLVSGSAFGADSCVRLSYAASDDDLREAVRRLANCLEGFK